MSRPVCPRLVFPRSVNIGRQYFAIQNSLYLYDEKMYDRVYHGPDKLLLSVLLRVYAKFVGCSVQYTRVFADSVMGYTRALIHAVFVFVSR